MADQYLEYTSAPDKDAIDSLDATLTVAVNAITPVQGPFLVRQSAITPATAFFLRLPHPTIPGRELVLVPEAQQPAVPAGVVSYSTNFEVENWYENAPSAITGLRLWLRADLGVTTPTATGVSLWPDQSGNGNDYAQSTLALRPNLIANVINGHPVVRGNGFTQYLSNASQAVVSGSGSRTVLIVFNPKTVLGEVVFSDGNQGVDGGNWNFLPTSVVSTIGGNAGWAAFTPNVFSIAIINQNGIDTQNITLRVNGGVNVTRTSLTNQIFNVQASSSLFAQLVDPNTIAGLGFSDADIADLAVYDRSLSAAEEDLLFGYASDRYAL